MDDWEKDDWENDDWVPPDFSNENTNTNEASIKKKEEQRLVEEADAELTEDLFFSDKKAINKIIIEQPTSSPAVPIKKKQKDNKSIIRNKEIMIEQKKASEMNKNKKAEKKRQMEIFGQAELDEYADQYLYIEDKYN